MNEAVIGFLALLCFVLLALLWHVCQDFTQRLAAERERASELLAFSERQCERIQARSLQEFAFSQQVQKLEPQPAPAVECDPDWDEPSFARPQEQYDVTGAEE
jgi:inhibitor of KinA sporulation pathway (predicted exonuclease)